MDAMTESSFDTATFFKLAGMFASPFRDEADKLLRLALADLRKEQNLVCDQFKEVAYAKSRRDECAGLRYDLKQAFALYGEGELNADELQDIIARVAERSAEIADDMRDNDYTQSEPSPPPSHFADFHIPEQAPPATPIEQPFVAPETETLDDPPAYPAPARSSWWPLLIKWSLEKPWMMGWLLLMGAATAVDFCFDPDRANWPWIGWSINFGFILLWLLRKLLPMLGWFGLLLKIALAVDCVFVCYVIGFRELPWRVMRGGPFPTLAQPIYPFVISCVLAASLFIMPEMMEWFQQKTSRLRLVFFAAVALIVISGFAVRNPIKQIAKAPDCNNPKNWTGTQCDEFIRTTKPPIPLICSVDHTSTACEHYHRLVIAPMCADPLKQAFNQACQPYQGQYEPYKYKP